MIDALLLIQDVQLLCFAVIFGFVTLQHPGDKTRRWLWYSFMANAMGAVLDFATPHLPAWIGRGINMAMIPLSYALVHVAIVFFLRRYRWTIWISGLLLLGSLPLNILWSGRANQVPNDSLVDLVIGLQVLVTAVVLLGSSEQSTKWPRALMSGFFFAFAPVELLRAFVAFVLHQNPDVSPQGLGITSSVAYVVSISILPLAFLWMINSRVEADLVQQNMRDPLTHVLNRRGLRQALDREMSRHTEPETTLTLAMLDLDHFKQLNDTYGHASGDAVLIGLAELLRELLRETDTLARIGGEEFVLLLPHTGEAEAMVLLERLRHEMESYTEADENGVIHVTASFGATCMNGDSFSSASDLLRQADLALYRAKQQGRNRVCCFDQEEDRGTLLRSRQYLS